MGEDPGDLSPYVRRGRRIRLIRSTPPAQQARRRKWTSRLRSALIPGTLRFLAFVFGLLPRRTVLAIGGALGWLAWRLSGRDRRRALEHLALAFPEKPDAERTAIARDCFRHVGKNLSELLHLFRRERRAILACLEVEGWENVQAARATGHPLLFLTAHCGNWELIATVVHNGGISPAAVARPLDDPALQKIVVDLRAHFGTTTIARGTRGAARQLLETLRRGGALAMLIDQDTKVDGVWVPFFGRPAFTPVGAAEIALRQHAQVIPSFIFRREDGSHLVQFLPALDLPNDPREATAVMTAGVEEHIRRHPEQWVWWHKRWRRQEPAQESGNE